MRWWIAAIGSLICVAIVCSLNAQNKKEETTVSIASVRTFVQGFYDWYLPKALEEHPATPSLRIALTQKATSFTPALLDALKQDAEAQAKVKGYIVGLDFDPFLSSQDPCEHYVVGKIIHDGNKYLVDVYGVCSEKRPEKPDVVAEVVESDHHLVFQNFRYPADATDLLTILKELRKSRL